MGSGYGMILIRRATGVTHFPTILSAIHPLNMADICIEKAKDYEVIGLLKAEGVDGEAQSSTNYSMTTTTGLKEEAQTTVEDWNLY